MNDLKNYRPIVTDDGSITLFSEVYGEACHSTSGAREETRLHYINGCDVIHKSTLKQLTIFEVGFGVGIGFEETLLALPENNFQFITTEIDEELIKYIISKNKIYNGIERKELPFLHYYLKQPGQFELIILVGDARESVPKLRELFNEEFDCIYQDAFSPKRNAILWTKEWFKLLYKLSNTDCIMSTYSSSSSVRKSMIAGGWNVSKGDKFGPKRSSTRARMTGVTDESILEHLERSPAITITDQNYQSYVMDKK